MGMRKIQTAGEVISLIGRGVIQIIIVELRQIRVIRCQIDGGPDRRFVLADGAHFR